MSVYIPNPDWTKGTQHIGLLAEKRIDEIEEMRKHPELYVPISTGIDDLDKAFDGGVVLPSLIAIGGAKKIGKTVFAVHLALQMSKLGRFILTQQADGTQKEVPIKVLAFHLEETRKQYTDRVITNRSELKITRSMIRNLTLVDDDIAELREVQKLLDMQYNLYVDDSVLNIDQIIAIAKQLEAHIIVVDTFNLVRGGVGASVQERMADISSKLLYARNTAKLTSIVIHHKNREGEDFGSDALSRDADLRITVTQPEDIIKQDGYEGVLRLTTENSRQAAGGTIVDVSVSFSQSKIEKLNTTTFSFPHLGESLISQETE